MDIDLPLVDHHCHGVVRDTLSPAGFDALLSEGGAPPAGMSNFDTALGLAVLAHCAPLLDLDPHVSPAVYLAGRAALGAGEVNSRLLRASGTASFLVDTGYRGGEITSPAELAVAAGGGASAREIVRLETVAESVAASGLAPREFPDACAGALFRTAAVGVKSVAAYRVGLDFDPTPPTAKAVAAAAARWLDAGPGAGGWRVDDPVLIRFLLWTAVDLGRPIQFHTGFGDADVTLNRVNPVLLTAFIRAVPPRVPIMLLHCYPYHREAAYLAAVYPHVYVDVGLALNFVGPPRAGAVLAEALELTPYAKMLYSSDAFGLAELYFLGASVFRRALGSLLSEWVAGGECSGAGAARIAELIGAGNATRVYGLA